MSNSRTNTWLATVVRLKCPRCRVGELFPTATFAFKEPFEMHKSCPKCHLNYWPEPGFYYGAMFMSYILFSFPFLGLVIFLHWVLGWTLGNSMFVLMALAAVSFVYIFRVARSLWLALNAKYDQQLSDDLADG